MKWFYLFWVSILHDASHQGTAQENIWLDKFQEGCLVHDHLWYPSGLKEAFLSLCLAWPIQSSFCSWVHNIMTYGLVEDVVWRMSRWLLSAWPSLVSECYLFNIFPIWLMHTIKFSRKRIYGLEYVVWRIWRWLFSAQPFLICAWDEFGFSESPNCLIHPIKFLLVTIYELGDVVWIKYEDGCLVFGHLWYVNGMILFILSLHVAWCLPLRLSMSRST